MGGTVIAEVRRVLLANVADLAAFSTADADGHMPLVTPTWAIGDKSAEKVYTETATFHHEPASLKSGRTFRNEQGRFLVVIRVEGIDKSQEDTTARCVALGTVFEEYVADNRTSLAADVPGLNWIVMDGDGALVEMFNEQGTLALLSYPVMYDARLT